MADLELYYDMRNAIKAGSLERMKKLINNYGLSYCPVWDDGYQLLSDACAKNHFHLAAFLLSKNPKINSDCALVSPLQAAAMNDNTKLVKLLLEHGAKAYTNKNKAPIRIAVENKNFEIAKLLFEHKAVDKAIHESTDNSDDLLLHLAVRSREYSIIKLLLDNCFNVNISDYKRRKPIHLAINSQNLNVIQLLLDYGADINAKIVNGDTPLFLALYLRHNRYENEVRHNFNLLTPTASEQHLKILNLLLDYNADINIVGQGDYTLLDVAYFRAINPNVDFNVVFRGEDNVKNIEAIIKQIVKLRFQNAYVSTNNLEILSSIDLEILVRFQKKCEEELSQMVNEIIPNTTISLYNYITKNDKYLASYVKNVHTKEFVFSDEIGNRFPIYASTAKVCFSRGLRRKVLLEESMQIFENNWPYASRLLSNCLEYIFMNLNNNDLQEFIWMFKQ